MKRRCKIELHFNEEYVLVFEQNGCRSKALTVNTKRVPVHVQHELLDFAFDVSLDQPLDKIAKNDAQIVAHWYYHSDFGEFNYMYDKTELAEYEKQFIINQKQPNEYQTNASL